jgi:hypothetical protein
VCTSGIRRSNRPLHLTAPGRARALARGAIVDARVPQVSGRRWADRLNRVMGGSPSSSRVAGWSLNTLITKLSCNVLSPGWGLAAR